MSTLDAIERFGLDRAVLWTHPPLVHFTTADLNNLADGRYDMPAFANVLHEMNAVVLVTPEHLMEWVPVAADSQRRRLALADSLPMSFAEWGYSTAWTPGPTTELQTATAAQLEWLFYDERREVREWLEKRRAFWRGMGEADFFWRAGQASNGGTIAEFEREGTKLMERFHQKNARHGSDVTAQWRRTVALGAAAERTAPWIRRLIPSSVRARIDRVARRYQKKLDKAEVQMHARLHGVDPDNVGFALWWNTWQRLRRKPSETGGLGDEIDLLELRMWPVCALMSLDKRVWNAVRETMRELGLAEFDMIAERFVRAGREARLLNALEQLRVQRATVLAEVAGGMSA